MSLEFAEHIHYNDNLFLFRSAFEIHLSKRHAFVCSRQN